MPPPNSKKPVRNNPWTSAQEKRKKDEKKKAAAAKATAPAPKAPAASKKRSASGACFSGPRSDDNAQVAPLNSLGAPTTVIPCTASIQPAGPGALAIVNPALVSQASAPQTFTVPAPASVPAATFYSAPSQVAQQGQVQPSNQLIVQQSSLSVSQQTTQLLAQLSAGNYSVPAWAHAAYPHQAPYAVPSHQNPHAPHYAVLPQGHPHPHSHHSANLPTSQSHQIALVSSAHHSFAVANPPPTFNAPISNASAYQQAQLITANHQATFSVHSADGGFTFTYPLPILNPPWDVGQYSVRSRRSTLKSKRTARQEALYRRWKTTKCYQQLQHAVREAAQALKHTPQEQQQGESTRKRRRRTADPIPAGEAPFDHAGLRRTFQKQWAARCISSRPSVKRTREPVPTDRAPEHASSSLPVIRTLLPCLHPTTRARLMPRGDAPLPASAPCATVVSAFPPSLMELHLAAKVQGTTLECITRTQEVWFSQYDPFVGCKVVQYKVDSAPLLLEGEQREVDAKVEEMVERKVLGEIKRMEKVEVRGGVGRRVLAAAGVMVAAMAVAWWL